MNGLWTIPEYRLGMTLGEADALSRCLPADRTQLNDCCIVRGYVEAFSYYDPAEFPWDYVRGIIKRMRKRVPHDWSGHGRKAALARWDAVRRARLMAA